MYLYGFGEMYLGVQVQAQKPKCVLFSLFFFLFAKTQLRKIHLVFPVHLNKSSKFNIGTQGRGFSSATFYSAGYLEL